MLKWFKKRMISAPLKRERGDGAGISYAMFLVGIMTVSIIFAFVIFNANLYIVKSELETGLHIVEQYCLTTNASGYEEGHDYTIGRTTDGNRFTGDKYESELRRRHIITAAYYDNILHPEEQEQCSQLGDVFTERLSAQMLLASDGVTPRGGMLGHLSKGRWGDAYAKLRITGPVVIYEPCYRDTIVITMSPERRAEFEDLYGNLEEIDLENLAPQDFTIKTNIEEWVKYELTFDDSNHFLSATKVLITDTNGGVPVVHQDESGNSVTVYTPRLKNGNLCEGATIESTVRVPFYGVNKIYASGSDVANRYSVSVTQSVDIVLASKDSRFTGGH